MESVAIYLTLVPCTYTPALFVAINANDACWLIMIRAHQSFMTAPEADQICSKCLAPCDAQ